MSPDWKSNAQGESKALRRRALDDVRIVCIVASCSRKNAQLVDSRLSRIAYHQKISACVAALTSLVYRVVLICVAE
jgi:hypothetical protein